ncbi:MAG TPA: hypothetical protein VHX38_30595 [Pseudonocardiaceae bacterium]|jgi:hypothetical protein|nr:hypothetical protein [Pseudonocardiaceae bacterium]
MCAFDKNLRPLGKNVLNLSGTGRQYYLPRPDIQSAEWTEFAGLGQQVDQFRAGVLPREDLGLVERRRRNPQTVRAMTRNSVTHRFSYLSDTYVEHHGSSRDAEPAAGPRVAVTDVATTATPRIISTRIRQNTTMVSTSARPPSRCETGTVRFL